MIFLNIKENKAYLKENIFLHCDVIYMTNINIFHPKL